MHKLSLIAVLLLTVTVTPAVAQTPARPKGAPPKFLVISRLDRDNDRIYFLATHVRMVPVTVTKAIQRNGVTSYVNVTEYRSVRERSTHSNFLSKTKIFNTAGKELASAKDKLKVGMTVVVSADGNPIDPVFRKVLRENTLLLVIPISPVRAQPRPPVTFPRGRALPGLPPPPPGK